MRILAMTKRVLIELFRDKRTLAMMFMAPLLILTLMYALFQDAGKASADLAVQSVDATLLDAMKTDGLRLHVITTSATGDAVNSADTNTSDANSSRADSVTNGTGTVTSGTDSSSGASSSDLAIRTIRDHDYAGYLQQHGNALTLTLAGADQSKTALIEQSLQAAQIKLSTKAAATTIAGQAKAIRQLQATVAELNAQIRALKAGSAKASTGMQTQTSSSGVSSADASRSVTTHYLYGGKDASYFTTLVPILMGFVVFFFVFLISGIALLHERTTGTLFRLLATPIHRHDIIAGYLAAYGAIAVVQTLAVVTYTLAVFKTQILGSLGYVILINLLLAGTALTLGLLISTFATTEFQMMQFIPLLIIPQIFFSGIISLDAMPGWLQAVARLMPLYWGASSMTAVVQKGAGFTQIAPHLGVLALFIAVFLGLNLLVMRRYRRV